MSQPTLADPGLFFHAIAMKQTELVTQWVQADRSLLLAHDARNFGATPLTAVCYSDQRTMIELLIRLGADLNRRSDWAMGPWSPLHCAMYQANHDLGRYLISQGADLDAHGAAGLGLVDELRQILSREPSRVDERGGDGVLPLHFADNPTVSIFSSSSVPNSTLDVSITTALQSNT